MERQALQKGRPALCSCLPPLAFHGALLRNRAIRPTPTAEEGNAIGLFIPCYVDAFFPRVGVATLELLEKLGSRLCTLPTLFCPPTREMLAP